MSSPIPAKNARMRAPTSAAGTSATISVSSSPTKTSARSSFRLPFFWHSSDGPVEPDTSTSSNSKSTFADSTRSNKMNFVQDQLPAVQPVPSQSSGSPLFPEETDISGSSSSLHKNMNTFFQDVTSQSASSSSPDSTFVIARSVRSKPSRRRQHLIAPARGPAPGPIEPSSSPTNERTLDSKSLSNSWQASVSSSSSSSLENNDDPVVVDEKGEEVSPNLFKGSVDSQSNSFEDLSLRNEVASPHFATAFRKNKKEKKPRRIIGPIRDSSSRSASNEYDNYTEKSPTVPPVLHTKRSGFAIPFRSSKTSLQQLKSRSSDTLSGFTSSPNNLPDWLPASTDDSSGIAESAQLVATPLISGNGSLESIMTNSTPGDVGPVELDTIVPQSIQPPTLLQSWNDHYRSEDTFLLTDRFGFIYDKQHRPVLPPPEPGSLSSNTGARFLENIDNGFEFWFVERDTPSEADLIDKPEPAHLSGIVSSRSGSVAGGEDHENEDGNRSSSSVNRRGNAEESLDVIKNLLTQLTDLHDNLQRLQKTRWDEYLRKLNEVGAESFTPMSMDAGELFGFHGRGLLSNKFLNGRARYKEFKALVLGGIPVVYRSKIWSECGGADSVKVPGVYEELINIELDRTRRGIETEDEAVAQIDLDLFRTMPTNVFFGGKGPGVPKLKRVLIAFSRRNPDIGYCQGMNMIAATLLLTHATEEDAFWTFVSVIEKILPQGYFSPPLLTSRADQRVLKQYLKELQPKLWDHLVNELDVDIEAITFNWFLSCFTDGLPAEVLFRVWDVFVCVEGEVYLFRVALALFRIFSKDLLALDNAAEAYSFMKNMSSHPISIDGLIRLADSLRTQVRMDEVSRRRRAAIIRMEDES
ncbi:rab-GTPase-TBC domain-containing protein [Lipomyces oligophaga]|uniref:rab-GTPase-TBC domain-containing protein n=1 Tax=Lipomyces oligophaga TaxID=45792 RepID=UPI0034CD67B7